MDLETTGRFSFLNKEADKRGSMTEPARDQESPVKITIEGPLVTIALNRPQVLNSLNLEIIRQIRAYLEKAKSDDACKCVLLCGIGDRAFCAGGDIKAMAQWVKQDDFDSADLFFKEEYALDLFVHQFPKPLLVLIDGIAMGGGLGLAAGADLVIATEKSRMAMPETGIGFFPDVGATKWLFDKCPPGYAEFLGLTGYTMQGADTVRCGLATHLVPSENVDRLISALKELPDSVWQKEGRGLSAIRSLAEKQRQKPASQEAMGNWVQYHFADKSSLQEILNCLKDNASRDPFSQEILKTLIGRSPTALTLTFLLFGLNKKRPLKEGFQIEQKAAAFMIRHPDYLEGVRAQILEKDHRPRWNPDTIEKVGVLPDFLQ
jgi:enoyl-CoA hydratase/carnithine racemase